MAHRAPPAPVRAQATQANNILMAHRQSPLRPHVHIRYGYRTDGKLRFMYAPLIQTLARGLNASGAAVTVESITDEKARNQRFVASMTKLGVGDTFIWVGPKQHYQPPWQQMRANGVVTVYYQTEPLGTIPGCFLPPNRKPFIPPPGERAIVDEVWDYSRWNLQQCLPHAAKAGITLRHVPPGFIGDGPMPLGLPRAMSSSSPIPLPPRAYFLGDVELEQRKACFAPLRHLVTPVNDVWDERALSELMSRGGDGPVVFLNLHKRCEKPEVTQPLESVRLSQLLSFGGLLVSQRSNPTDEAAYEGLVTFAPRASLQKEVTALLRRGNLSEIARERAALFQQRFLPEKIIARALARPLMMPTGPHL